LLVNAQHIKQVPGRKTDVKDSEWIAQLLQYGLLARLNQRITEVMPQPMAEAAEIQVTAPGIAARAAKNVLAELGTNMDQFPTAGHLSSWVGLCPGNRESAGKRKSGRTTKGNQWLRATLVQVAWAASHSKGPYLAAQYRRLAGRRGKKKALVVVAHSILIIIYYMLKRHVPYRDLGPEYLEKLESKQLTRHLVRRLERLGHKVVLEKAASTEAETAGSLSG
jgi:transposase